MGKARQKGFTLIEMSIVLVIIGLIVGGVLVGRDLIRAAEVRATITQIEKYNTATNTFRGKYDGYLPGDLNASVASRFGFAARGQYAGEGDGNGVIEGVSADGAGGNAGNQQSTGETAMFWVDLSQAGLIDGSFNTASSTVTPGAAITGAAIGSYLPQAKLAGGNYIYVYSGAYVSNVYVQNGINYFGFSAVTQIGGLPCVQCMDSNTSLSVQEAASIDAKVDDGLPQTGNIVTVYLNRSIVWAGTGNNENGPYTFAEPGSATSCFDNSSNASGTPGVAGAAQHYSVEMNGGSNVNCALSFKFQ